MPVLEFQTNFSDNSSLTNVAMSSARFLNGFGARSMDLSTISITESLVKDPLNPRSAAIPNTPSNGPTLFSTDVPTTVYGEILSISPSTFLLSEIWFVDRFLAGLSKEFVQDLN